MQSSRRQLFCIRRKDLSGVSKPAPSAEAPPKANARQSTGAFCRSLSLTRVVRDEREASTVALIQSAYNVYYQILLDIITQINVFTIPQGEQDALIASQPKQPMRRAKSLAGLWPVCTEASMEAVLSTNAQSVDPEAAKRVFGHLTAKGLIEGNKRFGEAHPVSTKSRIS